MRVRQEHSILLLKLLYILYVNKNPTILHSFPNSMFIDPAIWSSSSISKIIEI